MKTHFSRTKKIFSARETSFFATEMIFLGAETTAVRLAPVFYASTISVTLTFGSMNLDAFSD